MAKNTPEGAKMKWKFGSKIDATTVLSEKKTKKGNEEKAKSKEVETEKINLLADDYVFPEKKTKKAAATAVTAAAAKAEVPAPPPFDPNWLTSPLPGLM